MNVSVVKLVRYTPEPDRAVVVAARECYSDLGWAEIDGKLNGKEMEVMISKLRQAGHLSPFEHAYFTFEVSDISRVTSHQIVRHRLASYSQQSQRYVEVKDFKFVIPPSIQAHPELLKMYVNLVDQARDIYKLLISDGIPKEDARYVLPQSISTRLVVSMNARELLYFFRLRLCSRAQWEIRDVAAKMLDLVKEVAPLIFENAGPPCVSVGVCMETSPCKKEFKNQKYLMEVID